jgi:sulfhydrogenase subunit alpha
MSDQNHPNQNDDKTTRAVDSFSGDKNGMRRIRVDAMTRVEGEGGLDLRVRDGAIEKVHLHIFEPPRFFEALLRDRPIEDVPDITARICGICPVAYQMSSVHAIESGLGVQVSGEVRALRRLLYCAEWIESHALHVHMLHLPDFLGFDGSLEMAQKHPDAVQRALRLRKYGNELLERIGGRAIHPINVAIGGFYRAPRVSELSSLIPDLETGLQLAIDAIHWIAELPFPDFQQSYQTVSLVHPDEYPMNEGRIQTNDGLSISSDQFENHFAERQVEHSTAMHATRIDNGSTYLLGPIARLDHCRDLLKPIARRVADEIRFETPCRNPFRAILARSIELIHAYEEAIEIIKAYRPPEPAKAPYSYRQTTGAAATEAPRGLLYHRYQMSAMGKVEAANIVPPTSQNQSQIEQDLRDYLPHVLDLSDQEVGLACERLVRCYDPCISCSTHFLKVRLERL